MTFLDYRIINLDPHKISEELLDKYFDLDDQFCYELDPNDAPYTHELQKKMIQATNPESENIRWLVVAEKVERVIGFARVRFVTEVASNYESAKKLADIEILIGKEYRGKGLGTKLLVKILERINQNTNITTISASLIYDVGHAFCEKFKGKVVQEEAEYRAYLSEIDWQLMNDWKQAGKNIAQKEGITLERFEKCPADLIDEYTDIYTATVN
ncbi:MAG: GNAT family N-acetyltransferase, partial [Candidatus Heimdallarchaeota archaeon]